MRGNPIGTIIVVDARGFKAPRGVHQARDHIGTYYDNLNNIFSRGDCKPVWARMMWRFRDALNTTDPSHPIIVAFYCKSGKHRSVGLAWALTTLLRERGWVVELRHTMRE